VSQGWGGAALLDSYQLERKPIALNNVSASTGEFVLLSDLPSGPEIEQDTEAGADMRRRWAEAFKASNQANSPIFTENLRLGYCYEPSPICVPDGSPRVALETKDFVAVARPGTRAPHAWLDESRSMLDLFGNGFVLLRLGATPPDAEIIVAAAAKRDVPLTVVDVADPKIAALYERSLVLVRPDGHVSWRADAVPADPLGLIDRVRGA
jgi:hypothetical protein